MFVNCGLFSLLAFALLATLTLSVAPRSGGANVAVMFPPWTSSADAVERATATGGTLVRAGRLPFVVIVHPGSRGLPSSPASLGAWLLLDASTVPGCSPTSGRRV